MDTVSVAEFRKNMKAMLDSALHDPVFIRRGDDIYQLSHYGEVGVVKTTVTADPGFDLNLCNNCMQMTNWKNGMCQKCKTPQKKIAGAAPKVFEGYDLGSPDGDAIVKAVQKANGAIEIQDVKYFSPEERRPSDVLKDIDTLKATLEAEKAENELNQDPDYWADFNVRYKKIDELWAEYHRLRGTK